MAKREQHHRKERHHKKRGTLPKKVRERAERVKEGRVRRTSKGRFV